VCSDFRRSGHIKNVPRKPQQLKILGDAIRQHRVKAGLSQEKLAEKADLHPVYIGKIERGEQWISLHALLRVAKAVKVKASDLINEL
jgi:transcriptional regulator with XRE-family HTH domain